MRRIASISTSTLTIGLVSLLAAGPASADDSCIRSGDPAKGKLVEVELSTGERLKGVYGGCSGAAVLINHTLLGLLVIPRGDVEAMAEGELPQPVPVAAPVPTPDAEVAASEIETKAAEVTGAEVEADSVDTEGEIAVSSEDGATEDEELEKSPWTVKVDLGLDGTQGNSNDFHGRIGGSADWKSELRQFVSSINYILDMNGRSIDDQKGTAMMRHDWLIPASRWRYWVGTTWDYSDSESWDFRGVAGTGPAYEIIMNERTELLGLTGFAVSREFGGDDTEFHPEWVLGYTWSHKLTDRWTLVSNSNYYQKLDDGEFRFVTEDNADYKLSNEHDIALRFGIKETYNSDPDDDDDHNDLSYWLSLVLGL